MMLETVVQMLFGFGLLALMAAPSFVYASLRLSAWSLPERFLFAFIVVVTLLHLSWMSLMAMGILSATSLHIVLWTITVLQCAAVWRLWKPGTQLWPDLSAYFKEHRILSGLLTVLAAAATLHVLIFPEMMTDALSYHPLKALIPLQTGTWPQGTVGEPIMSDAIKYYPGLGSTLQGFWFTLPGGTANNMYGSLLGYFAGGIATYSIARHAGANVAGSGLASALFMIAPITFSLGTSGHVDLTGAVFALIAIVFLPFGSRPHLWQSAAITALALGLGMAVRYNMIVAAALLGLLAAGTVAFSMAHKDVTVRRGLVVLILMAACFAAVAFPQYIYNIAATGNPLAPHKLDIGPFHLDGHYLPDQNAYGAYTAHLEEDFKALPQAVQTFWNLLDMANYTWREHNWNGFVRVGWGNTLSFAVLPALICFLIFGARRLYMAMLAALGVFYILSIPYAMGEPRFHLLGGLMLFPALALFWDMIADRSILRRVFAIYLALAVFVPQALMLMPVNFGRNWIDMNYQPQYGDHQAPRAEDGIQLAMRTRPEGWRVIAGPGASNGNNVYYYSQERPLSTPVTWNMMQDFKTSEATSRAKEKGVFVVCNETRIDFGNWCEALAKEDDYRLVMQNGPKRLYVTRSSFESDIE